MEYINNEIINMIDKAFPETAHLGRYVVKNKIVYGFDKVYEASLSNLVEILVFDIENFTFKFNEDSFFQQTPDSILSQIVGRFDNDSVSKILSEFLLRRDEFIHLKEKCEKVSGQDIFDALDSLKPILKEVYKGDPFNPKILEKKVEKLKQETESMQQEEMQKQEDEYKEEEEIDWLNGIIDTVSSITILVVCLTGKYSQLITFFLTGLYFILTARCYVFIVNLLKFVHLKIKSYAEKRNKRI